MEEENKIIVIPKPMVDEVKRIIESCPGLGFESVEEFIREGIRKNIIVYGTYNRTFKGGIIINETVNHYGQGKSDEQIVNELMKRRPLF